MIRDHFPIFKKHPNLVYLDNAATTQRPDIVIDAMQQFHASENANTHRGIYQLSSNATQRYEETRSDTAKFLGTQPENIAFTRGTTESINIVAEGFLAQILKPGDNIVTTVQEHHSNFIPWQVICKKIGAEFRVVSLDANNLISVDNVAAKVDQKTKLLAIGHISNTLGTINPIEQITSAMHQLNIPVLIDAAQSAGLYELNVEDLNCDFLAFSAHKAFGPFGLGILYAHDRVKDQIQPTTFGGGMVKHVSVTDSTFKEFPQSLDVGTMNVSGVIGWQAALGFINGLDTEKERAWIHKMTLNAVEKINAMDGLSTIGVPSSGIISFFAEKVHPHDLATVMNEDHIAVRAGMHCTQPLMTFLQLPGTVRASFSIYNTEEEVDLLIGSIEKAMDILK